jgi:hypothetical protein
MSMKQSTYACAITMLAVAPFAYGQVPTTMVQAGYTGLGITPTARMLSWGSTEINYENQLSGVFNRVGGHNYVVGFGLLPNVEVAARLAANENSSNCFAVGGCGTRDLSASGKLSIPLDRSGIWHAAVGATDLGGSITYFRTYYGALTASNGPWELTGGFASRRGPGSVRGSRSPLDGPFASVAWAPAPVVRAHVEYADSNAWAGVRLFAPVEWLPRGWSASFGVNRRLTETNLTKESWWTASVSIPLYQVRSASATTSRQAEAALVTSGAGTGSTTPSTPAASAPQAIERGQPSAPPSTPDSRVAPAAAATAAAKPQLSDTDLADLSRSLQAKGLEDLWIGRLPDGAIAIRAENGTYAWNTADAIGAALGVIARSLGANQSTFNLVITQRQLPLVGVTGRADCLRSWIDTGENTCAVGQLTTAGTADLVNVHASASWVQTREKPSWRTVRLTVSPVLQSAVGTEFGVLDYDLAANFNARLPLWNGASVDGGVNAPLARTTDFEAGRIFGNSRVRSGIDRLAFTQIARIPFAPAGVVGQLTVGRMGTFFDGALAEARWEPGDGRHRVSASTGFLSNNDYRNGRGALGSLERTIPALANYRYRFSPTRTDVEATAGRFVYGDRGVELALRQWFDDVSVSLFYRRTTFPSQVTRQFAGIQLSLPIGPRRDWALAPGLQIGGTPRFSHGLQTSIQDPRGGNPLRLNHGVRPPTQSLDTVLNSDRTGLTYFEDNVYRIRQSAR